MTQNAIGDVEGQHVEGQHVIDRPPIEKLPQPTGIADPGPLGLAAFAGTTMFLSAINAGWAGVDTAAVFGLALFYGGIAQFLAGIWEFAKGNTFGALAFASYGGFWLSFWYFVGHLPTDAHGAPINPGGTIGLYLLVWTIFTFYMCIPASRVSGVVLAVFVLLAFTFLFLCWGSYGGNTTVNHVGGYLGIATAIVAWYGSLAGVTNSTYKRTVFPTFPLS